MRYSDFKKLQEKLFFTVDDLAEIFNITVASARVVCSRYTGKSIFIRLKNNFYVLDQKWGNLPREDFFRISNFLQVPSYISFMTALGYYEITTQVQQNFFESASLKRTRQIKAKGGVFNFYKLKKECYSGFVKQGDFFIATKEKAWIDAIYLYSFGKYSLDFNSIDFGKFEADKVANIIKAYPQKTRNIVKKLCRI